MNLLVHHFFHKEASCEETDWTLYLDFCFVVQIKMRVHKFLGSKEAGLALLGEIVARRNLSGPQAFP